jgi:hypothetical protein
MYKLARMIFLVVIYLPIIDLAIFYSFVIRAIIKLGYCPSYENPDPGELGFRFHYQLVYDTGWTITLSIVTLTYSAIFFLIKRKRIFDIGRKHFIIGFGLIVLDFLSLISPLGAWFLD